MSSTRYPAGTPAFQREGDLLHPSALASGPWYPGTQHGSAMMLMVALAADAHPSRQPRQTVRLTVDMMKAAPMGPIQVHTTLRKDGHHMEVLDISLTAQDEECVRASALRFRFGDVPVNDRVRHQGPAPVLPAPLEFDMFADARQVDGFHQALEIRIDTRSSPGIAWFRLLYPALAGATPTPLQRVAAAADWTYSVPGLVHEVLHRDGFGRASFYGINPDATVQLQREAEGEWIGIQTVRTYHDHGAGTAMGQLFDLKGPIGFCTQSVLIRPRPEGA
jgi:hypothetical protein